MDTTQTPAQQPVEAASVVAEPQPATEQVAQTQEAPISTAATCAKDECKCAHEQGIVIVKNSDGSFSQYSQEAFNARKSELQALLDAEQN